MLNQYPSLHLFPRESSRQRTSKSSDHRHIPECPQTSLNRKESLRFYVPETSTKTITPIEWSLNLLNSLVQTSFGVGALLRTHPLSLRIGLMWTIPNRLLNLWLRDERYMFNASGRLSDNSSRWRLTYYRMPGLLSKVAALIKDWFPLSAQVGKEHKVERSGWYIIIANYSGWGPAETSHRNIYAIAKIYNTSSEVGKEAVRSSDQEKSGELFLTLDDFFLRSLENPQQPLSLRSSRRPIRFYLYSPFLSVASSFRHWGRERVIPKGFS